MTRPRWARPRARWSHVWSTDRLGKHHSATAEGGSVVGSPEVTRTQRARYSRGCGGVATQRVAGDSSLAQWMLKSSQIYLTRLRKPRSSKINLTRFKVSIDRRSTSSRIDRQIYLKICRSIWLAVDRRSRVDSNRLDKSSQLEVDSNQLDLSSRFESTLDRRRSSQVARLNKSSRGALKRLREFLFCFVFFKVF